MQDTIRRLVKLTAGYSIVTLLGPLFTIVLTPLYTRVLSPADYGVADVALTLSSFITIFAVLGIDQALSVYYFGGDEQSRRNLVTTSIICVGTLGFCLAAGLMLAAGPLALLLFKNSAYHTIFYLLAVSVVSGAVYTIITAAFRLHMSIRSINILGISYIVILAVSNILLVLILNLKAMGVIGATAISSVLVCTLGLILVYKPFSGHFSRYDVKLLGLAGLGVLPGAISGLALNSIDRLLLTQYVAQSDIGLYSIANKLASMLYVLLFTGWSAWWPLALEMANKPDAKHQYAVMFEYVAAISMFLALFVGLFAREILAIFTRDVYLPAAPYATVLMITTGPLQFLTLAFALGPYITKRTFLVSLAALIGAGINIVLNLLLDPLIGVWGAVFATVIAAAIILIIAYSNDRRTIRVPYRLGHFGGLALCYLSLIGIFLLVPQIDTLLFKIAALLLFLLAIPATGILSMHQLIASLSMLRNRIQNIS